MKITKITLTQESLALKTPFITALRKVQTVEFVRVGVHLEDGTVLYGEAPATKAITGEDLQSITKDIDSVIPLLLQKDSQYAQAMVQKLPIGSSAKAALDIALHVTPKLQNIEPIQTDITISLNPIQKMLQDAHQAVQDGFAILKIKLGSDIKHAIDVTCNIAKQLPQTTLLIDANQAWSFEDTLFYIKTVRSFSNIALIEQPVKAQELEQLQKITAVSHIPILADESAFVLEDVKRIVDAKIADMVNIKLMKCGGVSEAVKILEFARKKGVTCMLGSMLEGPYSINAALYLAAAYHDVIKYVDLDSPILYKEYPAELDFTFSRGAYTPKPQVTYTTGNK